MRTLEDVDKFDGKLLIIDGKISIIDFSSIVTLSLVGSISFQAWIYNNLLLNVKLHSAAINLLVIQNLDISTSTLPPATSSAAQLIFSQKNRLNIRQTSIFIVLTKTKTVLTRPDYQTHICLISMIFLPRSREVPNMFL